MSYILAQHLNDLLQTPEWQAHWREDTVGEWDHPIADEITMVFDVAGGLHDDLLLNVLDHIHVYHLKLRQFQSGSETPDLDLRDTA